MFKNTRDTRRLSLIFLMLLAAVLAALAALAHSRPAAAGSRKHAGDAATALRAQAQGADGAKGAGTGETADIKETGGSEGIGGSGETGGSERIAASEGIGVNERTGVSEETGGSGEIAASEGIGVSERTGVSEETAANERTGVNGGTAASKKTGVSEGIGGSEGIGVNEGAAASEGAGGANGPVKITDDSGREIALPAPARRVIPLYASFSECLTALGRADVILARTEPDRTLPGLFTVGSHMNPNLELIVSLEPDLVLILQGRDEAEELAGRLDRLGIPSASFKIASFADLYSCIMRIGVLVGEQDAARRLVRDIEAELALAAHEPGAEPGAATGAVTGGQASPAGQAAGPGAKSDGAKPGGADAGAGCGAKPGQGRPLRRPTVFFEVRYPNLLAAGMDNMVSDIILKAGGVPCLLEYPGKFVRLSEEIPILMDPDIYLIQKGPMNKSPLPLSGRSHYNDLRAAKNGFCLIVDEDLFSRPGPNSVGAVRELSAIIHDWEKKTAAR